MTYLTKICPRCQFSFNTRPFYSKTHCKKCTNALRMKAKYQESQAKGRKVYVSGSELASKRAWRQRNKELNKKLKDAYNASIAGSLKNKQWIEDNLEKVQLSKHSSRLRKNGVKPVHTVEEWIQLKNEVDSTCLMCKRREPNIYLSRDHVIPFTKWPLFKGLLPYEYDDIKNIQPLCLSCNSSKGNSLKSLFEQDPRYGLFITILAVAKTDGFKDEAAIEEALRRYKSIVESKDGAKNLMNA